MTMDQFLTAFFMIGALGACIGLGVSMVHVSYDARAAIALEKLASGCP